MECERGIRPGAGSSLLSNHHDGPVLACRDDSPPDHRIRPSVDPPARLAACASPTTADTRAHPIFFLEAPCSARSAMEFVMQTVRDLLSAATRVLMHKPRMRWESALARCAAAALLAGLTGPAFAETFNEVPTRLIGPTGGQITVGASIGGQGGWTTSENKFDEEITHARAHGGRLAWHVSNWYHQGTVNAVLTPAFSPVKEGASGSRNHVDIDYWFQVPSGTAGSVVSSSLSDGPGQRLTYAAVRDDAGTLTLQAVGVLQGSGWTNTDPPPFDDSGVHYDIRSSGALAHDTWYRLHQTVDLNVGAQNDVVVYTLFNADGTTAWTSGNMPSWEDAYLAGAFAPVGTVVTANYVGFRIIENPDHLAVRTPYGYAANRPAGLYIDDLGVTPNTGTGTSTGFENDRYVSPSGTDSGDCSSATPDTARCKTIAYALSQAGPGNTIHVASGTYDEAGLTITQPGLQLVGDAGTRPVITNTSGGTNQRLLVVNNTRDVRIEHLDFHADKSHVGAGILAMGNVEGLVVNDNHFVQSQSTAASSTFRLTNAIAINYSDETASPAIAPYYAISDGSTVTITNNTVEGDALGLAFRAGIQMDRGLGTIRGNTIVSRSQDLIVRFATITGQSTTDTVQIDHNTFNGSGVQIASPNAGVNHIAFEDNTVDAFSGNDTATYASAGGNPADFSVMRIIHNDANVPLTLSRNHFLNYAGGFRGVLIENFPNVALDDNEFTPRPGAPSFVSLVISNKEITTDPMPSAPLAFGLTATNNVFNGNGTAGSNVGTAVELLNDNDAGSASYGSILFGSAGQENQFSGDLRWYFHLDDYTCDHAGSTSCGFLNYPAVGTIPDTLARPFTGNVSAANNVFDTQLPANMDSFEQSALLGRTYDINANNQLGTVDYGLAGTEAAAYVDDNFAGHFWGDALTFNHGETGSLTVYFGVNAFATIGDGAMHVVDGGTVYVARGTYSTATTIAHRVQVVGDGGSDDNPANSTVVTAAFTINASGADAGNRLLLRDFTVAGVPGDGIVLAGSQSHITLDHVSASGNAGNGFIAYTANAAIPSTTTDLAIIDSHFDNNGNPTALPLVAGMLFDEDASVDGLSITRSSFNGNNAAGLTFNDIGAPASHATITNVDIVDSDFSYNNPADALNGGGGLWLKTSAAGSVIDGVTITGSNFADNGTGQTNNVPVLGPRKINANGISVRARPGTTISNVHICGNTFAETAAPSTQLVGIYVFDDTLTTNHGYSPIEVCASNTFNGLAHSVSGYEQFGGRGNQPVVDITGGSIANTEYINGLVTRIHSGTPNGTFSTIGAAMNDAGTVDGDEIHAPAGYYNEAVTITHDDMTLSGDAATVIDGTGIAGSGVTLPAGRTGVTLDGFTVRNFTALGPNDACVAGHGGNNHTTISNLVVDTCAGGGKGGIYLAGGGGIDDVTIDHNEVKNIGAGALRGIVIWDGLKTNIRITDNDVHDLVGCCGIELQDGTASGVTVTGNQVTNVGDSGMAFMQLTSGAGPNLIANNTITNTGRFGIELKLPDGNGLDDGSDGSIVVRDNTIDGAGAKNLRDRAGIGVQRRAYCTTCGENDVTRGVVVRNNTVRGFRTTTTDFEGYGIAVEGFASNVHDNILEDNDVGLQVQQANPDSVPNGAGGQDGNQDVHTSWFGRGNAPLTCIDVGTNTLAPSNTLGRRDMPAGASMVGADVTNLDTGATYCSITAAVAAATAGDHIQVAAGTHAENAIVTKPVTITGAGQALTTLVPAAYDPLTTTYSGAVLRVRASDVEISDLAVDGINPALAGHGTDIAARAGIMTDIVGGPYANFRVHDTTVRNIYLRGIYAPDSPGGTGVTNFSFVNNTVSNVQSDPSSIGIFSRYGTGIVDHNTVDGANDAISANWSKGTTFSNNTVTNAGSGIHSDNNGGGGGVADLIEGNSVDCSVADGYGVWVFANYAATVVQNNTVTGCAVGLGAFGGRTSGSPPYTVTFMGNAVDGTGALLSTPGDESLGAWLSTTTFYYGEFDNVVDLQHNTITGFDVGVLTQRGGSKRLVSDVHMNRIVGNTTGWSDSGDTPNMSNGTSDFTNNWWGCNDNPTGGIGCDPALGSGDVDPWLVLTAAAAPPTISHSGFSTITADLTHNSDNVVVGTIFADGTPVAFAATSGNIVPASVPTTGGVAQSTFSGLPSGSATITAQVDNAIASVIVSITPATITLDTPTLDATYDGSPHAVTASTVPAGLSYAVTYDGSPTPPTNAGSYAVVASITDDCCEGTTSGTLTIHKATGTVTFDNLTYTGSAQTATAHITEEPATACTVTPATVGPNAGSYAASATCTGTNYDASGNGVVVIAKATSTITINAADLHQNYGSTHAVGASASPISSGHVDVTYDGSATVPGAVGTYSVLATLVDPNYEAAPASAVLTIGDASEIEITAASSQAMALVGADAPYTGFVDYTGTLRNSGAPTGQAVHTIISVVRIDDGNTTGENPIAIDAADVEACIYDPSGWAAQEPGNHNGCPQDYESLVFSQGSGAYNGRPAVTFRYPVNPVYDLPLPHIDPAVATPPAKFRFKRGDYQVHVSLVGADGTVYASAFDGTSVPEASISYDGATSGQAEDALLSTTRLRNTGGRVDGNVIVRVTLSDAASSNGSPTPLAAGDVEFAYQFGDTYYTLPWAGSASDGGLVTYFGPGSGFPLEDGYDATTAGRGIFHREGSYRLVYEVLDAATQTTVFASSTTAPITIGPNMVNFALSDLAQVYDGTPRAVTVTPNGVPHTTVYEPLVGASCPASPAGSNTTPPTDAGTYCVYVTATGTYQGSAQGTLVVAKANATVSLDDDDGTVDGTIHRTFNAAAQVVGAGSTPTVGSIVVTYDGSATAPSAAGTYGVVATVVDPNYGGQATGTLIVAANGGATIVLDAPTLNATWDGSPHAVTATTTPGGIAYAVTYVGDGATVYPLSPTPPTAAGQYHVVATTTDANYAPVSASGTLVIASAAASIALDASTLGATWDGSPHAVTATTTPAGLAYTVTYDGLLDPPSAVGSYAVVATITDADHSASAATGTLVISAAGATITLDAPTLSATYDGQPHVVTATTTPSGLAYAITYDGSATAPVNAGSYAIVATVTAPGHSGSASGTLTIAKATGVVSFSATNATFDGTPHAIGAVISQEPGNGAACTLTPSGEYPRVTAGGTLVSANCSGTNYVASGSTTLIVAPKPVTIGLSGLGSFPYDGAAHAATATVAGTVAGFPAGTVVTYTPGGASAPVAVGTYDVVATLDAASTNYTAPAANGTIIIGAANATVTLGSLAQVYDGTPRLVTATTTPAGLAVSLSYDGSATAPTNAGSYNVVATITEPGYSGSASGTLVVSKKVETVTLSSLSATYDGNPHAATATTSPDTVAVAITYDGSATAPTNAGSYSVVATVTDANHTGSASGTLTIAKKAETVTLSNLAATYDGSPHAATATTSPDTVAVAITYDGSATAPTNAGSYAVVATVTDPNYSGTASGTLTIAKKAETVTLSNLSATWDGNPHAATATTSPDTVAVAITYDGSATAPSEVGTYSVVATVTDPNYTGTASGTLQIVNGDASAIAANGATTFTGTAGQPLAGALPSVKVTDAGGHPVAGVAVTFTAGSGDGTLSGATPTTDQNGIATLGGWTLDATAGTDTVTATAAGVTGEVVFTATGTADEGNLSLTITDGRTATQVGRSLTYTITVGNGTASNASGLAVTDTLPAELDAATAHWQCITINGATCSASGTGDLADTIDLPAGSSVVYLLTVTVIDDVDGLIENTVTVGSQSASDATEIVIFRDGFDGGDGAEPLGHEAALGRLGGSGTLSLAVTPSAFGSLEHKLLARAVDGRLRVEAIRIDGDVFVRIVVAESGVEQSSAWARVVATDLVLGTAGGHVTLSGTDAALDLALGVSGTFTVVGSGN
jgi:uncharacterized repeat protein (TIGR01451 family)